MKKCIVIIIALICIILSVNMAFAATPILYGSFTGGGIWQWDGSSPSPGPSPGLHTISNSHDLMLTPMPEPMLAWFLTGSGWKSDANASLRS